MGICVVIVEFVHICGEVLQMIQRTKSHVNKPPTLGGEPASGLSVCSVWSRGIIDVYLQLLDQESLLISLFDILINILIFNFLIWLWSFGILCQNIHNFEVTK